MRREEVEREHARVANALRKRRLDVKVPLLYAAQSSASQSSAPVSADKHQHKHQHNRTAKPEAGCKGKGIGEGSGKGDGKGDGKGKGKGESLQKARSPPRQFTVGGLMLVFFATRVGEVATKDELVAFLRAHRCRSHDPQPRHMGMQLGLNFLVNGCWHPRLKRALRRGEYCLLDLTRTHPARATQHRAKAAGLDFDGLKRAYDGRCACCGSPEGKPHLKNPLLVTALERGHCDPRRPLGDAGNCIPMCSMCNMVYKDNAVLSSRGFVILWLKAVASQASPASQASQASDASQASEASEASQASDASQASQAADASKASQASQAADASKASQASEASQASGTSQASQASQASAPTGGKHAVPAAARPRTPVPPASLAAADTGSNTSTDGSVATADDGRSSDEASDAGSDEASDAGSDVGRTREVGARKSKSKSKSKSKTGAVRTACRSGGVLAALLGRLPPALLGLLGWRRRGGGGGEVEAEAKADERRTRLRPRAFFGGAMAFFDDLDG